jgi:hypothetical protein
MKKIFYLCFLLFIFTLFTGFNSGKEKKWKLEKYKNGIKIFSNVPEGETIKQVKAFTTVNSSLSTIISVLIDVPNYTQWIYNCSESNCLKKINNYSMIYYSVSDVPWPLYNRDLVLKNTVSQNKKTKVIYSISTPVVNVVPKKKGMIRIENMYGKWTITPKENGIVLLEYFLKLDVGGNVPDWIVNLFIENGPYQSMLHFKENLSLIKYKNAKLDFIVEPEN